MANKYNLSELQERLSYDKDTGVFNWIKPTSRRIKVGAIAGSPNSDGYILIKFGGMNLKAHRIAWAFVHGKFPEHELDHINRNPSDNRIENLRLANRSTNTINRESNPMSSTGVRGVSKSKNGGYQAAIRVPTGILYLGYFDTLWEARIAAESGRIARDSMHEHLIERLAARVPVGWLDGRGRFFYADDPMYKNNHTGMREVFAAGEGKPT